MKSVQQLGLMGCFLLIVILAGLFTLLVGTGEVDATELAVVLSFFMATMNIVSAIVGYMFGKNGD